VLVDTIRSGAIRPQGSDDEVGSAEGVEIGLAAHELFDLRVWDAISFYGPRDLCRPSRPVAAARYPRSDKNHVIASPPIGSIVGIMTDVEQAGGHRQYKGGFKPLRSGLRCVLRPADSRDAGGSAAR